MPEIAALAGLERLDMMLNDSMYGILFRDINPVRTFVDQRFSRQVHARAGIIINTGEDNYLTTADAVEAAHTVTTSQLLNEYFAKEAGLEDWQLGLGHAFEIDPAVPDSFRLELAHALLARELFPKAPLKWMPPTRHMTGDVFRGYLLDGFFNLAGALTGQGILLVGMMTEAVVTPWLSDRDLALQNVRYVLDAAGSPARGLPPRARRLHRHPGPPGAGGVDRAARPHRRRRARPARRDRRRHLRADEAPRRRRPRPRRRRRQGPRLLQPGHARSSRSPMSPLDATTAARGAASDRPASLRRHHRRRHGAAQLHPADGRTPRSPRARPPSWPTRWAWTPRWSCTPSRWARTSRSSSSTAGSTTSSTPARSRSSSATTRC